jgi:predicted enzyme related to lactoylglutathione lyase
MSNPRITGVGGIFFKSDDPAATRKWYADHFGMKTNDYGCTFKFRLPDAPDTAGHLQWSPFPADTKYFDPGDQEFMVNYRVEGIEELVEQLKANGVNVVDEIESYDYGKFVHVMDPDGIKIELWEPVDEVFTALEEA